jgi:membrane-bound metal-dependent hydrolase YbcI (DUF457 family)
MNGKAHAIIGGIAAYALGAGPLWGIIGGLLPDCDHRKAAAGQVLPLWLICKHRGRLTHSWIPVLVLSIITVALGWDWGLVMGYISHIVADSLTPMGVPLWGHKDKRYRFLFFRVR